MGLGEQCAEKGGCEAACLAMLSCTFTIQGAEQARKGCIAAEQCESESKLCPGNLCGLGKRVERFDRGGASRHQAAGIEGCTWGQRGYGAA